MHRGDARRAQRSARLLRDWIIYRFDQLLDLPPLAQVVWVAALTVLLVTAFSTLSVWLVPSDAQIDEPLEAAWWTLTHFLDGGAVEDDPSPRRVLGVVITATGILVLSLLTAFLASKMGERISDLRSGLNAVVERDHVLCLGYDPNVPALAREIARSGQRVTLVILSPDPKGPIESALRIVQRVPGSRLKLVIRTGDPRIEQALLRVAAHRSRKVLVIPPGKLDDDGSVRWTLSTLLALRRVVGESWRGGALVLARHVEAVELLELATEPGVAGPQRLLAEIIAADAVLAGILAQSTREEGVHHVLRRLLAFDGAELYTMPLPPPLAGKSFDFAHARIEDGVLVGWKSDERLMLCPRDGGAVLDASHSLVVLHHHDALGRTGGTLPPSPDVDPGSIVPEPRRSVSVIGCTPTLPHLLIELDGLLPRGSRVRAILGPAHERGRAMVAKLKPTAITIELEPRTAAELADESEESICRSDAVVILGHESSDDINGDASALATLLHLRRGMRLCGDEGAVRVVTEVRDPRSAAHVAPRAGDCIVSSDLIAMLLAQETIDASSSEIYREILHPGGARVAVRPRSLYLPDGAFTFAHVLAAARARGEVALGLYPDPRAPRAVDRELERQRLEEGDPMGGIEAWLNPPRATPIADDARIAVLTRSR